ncbi:MAG: class I SAM-dependent methyltransferase [Acidobacteriia bacterium]|nr:class I SAM-dependent methyltransferase [Terriglobia bacterium]
MGNELTAAVRPSGASVSAVLWGLRKPFIRVVIGYFIYFGLVVGLHFPYHTDSVVPPAEKTSAYKFYADIYSSKAEAQPDSDGSAYIETAKKAIEFQQVVPAVQSFVERYGLENKRVLDVGAGTGYLQDVVQNYVGLDISPTARRFFHKPFVEASATDMPFADGEFDAAWTIWVFEHVPNPEQGMMELRRIVKDGGLIFFAPAWNCPTWASEGYPVRPYSDFGIKGKLIKASLLLRTNGGFIRTYMLPIRALRGEWARLTGRPTHLHYSLLTPNFDHYWMPDSDAVNQIDPYEAMLWFTSRGDECLNCGPGVLYEDPGTLVIRVHKK